MDNVFDNEGYKTRVKDLFSKLKKIDNTTDLSSHNIVLDKTGQLIPLCKYNLNDTKIINKLTEWRNLNNKFFFSQFTATTKGTKTWINSIIFEIEDRILFLVTDKDKNMIGHVGFNSCLKGIGEMEIDAVLRGETAAPGIMSVAVTGLIMWAKETIKPLSICLHVFSDNKHAVRFYEQLGFKKDKLIPLQREEKKGKLIYRFKPKLIKTNRYALKMVYGAKL